MNSRLKRLLNFFGIEQREVEEEPERSNQRQRADEDYGDADNVRSFNYTRPEPDNSYRPASQSEPEYDEQPVPDNMIEFKNVHAQNYSYVDTHHTVIHFVHTLADCEGIINDLLEERQVLLNLEETEPALRQRVIDMTYGAAFALESDMKQVSRGTFIIARKGVLLGNEGGYGDRGGRNADNVRTFRAN